MLITVKEGRTNELQAAIIAMVTRGVNIKPGSCTNSHIIQVLSAERGRDLLSRELSDFVTQSGANQKKEGKRKEKKTREPCLLVPKLFVE